MVPALGDRTGTFMDSFRRAREDYPEVRTGHGRSAASTRR